MAVDIFSKTLFPGLVRCILPDLAQKQYIGGDGLELFPDYLNKIIRQLIRNIEPPCACTERSPFAENGLNEFNIARRQLIDLGKRGKFPPAAVIIRE